MDVQHGAAALHTTVYEEGAHLVYVYIKTRRNIRKSLTNDHELYTMLKDVFGILLADVAEWQTR